MMSAVNLTVIDDATLGAIFIDIIKDVYSRSGIPQPTFLQKFYGVDDRADELDLAKKQAEIRKIDAEAASASASP